MADGTALLDARPTTLYRAYDASGRLLYVGIAVNWPRRWGQHAERSPWYQQVTRLELTEYANRPDAMAAEKRVVAAEHPVHNIEHTPRDRRPWRTANEQHYYVRPFDYTAFTRRGLASRYRDLGMAINALISAITAERDEMEPVSQEDLAAIAGDLVRVIPFGDACNRCHDADQPDRFHYPFVVRLEGTQMQAFYYHEACGNRWRTFWHVDLPWIWP